MKRLLIGVAVVLTGAVMVVAQTTGAHNPPLAIRSMAGQDLFRFYCATCHGRDAKGDGPTASALRTTPADLRVLARRNDGRFPRELVADYLAGRAAVPGHGSAEMPVWGPIFRGLDGSDTRAVVRIDNLVAYLESLQIK